MKKKVTPRLTKQQRAMQDDVTKRVEALNAKREALVKEEQEVFQLRKKSIMEQVTQMALRGPELDAFVSALDGNPHLKDITVALLNAAQSKGVDMQQFQVKLVRLGIIV